MTKAEDTEYEDVTIASVKDEGNGYSFERSDGWSFYVSKESGVVPVVGSTARFYGKGIGYTVRGLDINGQEVFYRTPEQQEEKHRQDVEQMKAKRKREFVKAQSRLDLQYDALPRPFQRRLDRFRANNPDFRWEYEDYEMTVCREAVNIATALWSLEAVKEFRAMDWEAQTEQVKPLNEGHSGNTWGCACYLAEAFLTDPKIVEVAHGAMCPLVGCRDYGCVEQEAKHVNPTV